MFVFRVFWSVFPRIQTKCGARIRENKDTFHVVAITEINDLLIKYQGVNSICRMKDWNAMQIKWLSPVIKCWAEIVFPVQSFESSKARFILQVLDWYCNFVYWNFWKFVSWIQFLANIEIWRSLSAHGWHIFKI